MHSCGSDHLTYHAQRRSVRRHAGDGQPGSDAHQHGRRRPTSRLRPDATTSGLAARIGATRLHEQFTFGITDPPKPRFCRRRRRFRPGARPVRPDQRRFAARVQPVVHDQATGRIRPGRHQGGQCDIQTRCPPRPLRRPDGTATLVQPRLGVSYAVPRSGTVLRASYGRTLETPYNENLLLSAGYGLNGVFGAGQAPPPGRRNQGRIRHPAGLRPLARRRFRILQQAHGQRLRLRRPVQHADCLPRGVGSLANRRIHRTCQSRRAPRIQRLRRDGAHECDLLAARRRRDPARTRRRAISGSTTIRNSTRPQIFNTCSRSGPGRGRRLSWRYDSGLVAGAVGEPRRRARR